MSHARITSGSEFCGRMFSVLLLLVLAVLWHSGDEARSQRPAREASGSLHLSIHPDEGLRQIAHFLQKRQSDERKSGTLPDPALPSGVELHLAPRPPALRLAMAAREPLPAAPRAGRLARAPPRHLA